MLFLAGCGNYNLNYFTIPDDLEFIETITDLDIPQKISSYMIKNFTYEAHRFYAPDPYILWKIGKGDCNDFATFGVFIANYHGYETYQIEIFYKGTLKKHYIAIYNEGIWLSTTDNQYYYFGFDNFEESVDYVCYIRFKTWTKYIVYDYNMNIIERGYNE